MGTEGERYKEREREKNVFCFSHFGNDEVRSVIDIYLEVPGVSFRQEVEANRTHRL